MDAYNRAALLRHQMTEIEMEYNADLESGIVDDSDMRPWILAAMNGCIESLERASCDVEEKG